MDRQGAIVRGPRWAGAMAGVGGGGGGCTLEQMRRSFIMTRSLVVGDMSLFYVVFGSLFPKVGWSAAPKKRKRLRIHQGCVWAESRKFELRGHNNHKLSCVTRLAAKIKKSKIADGRSGKRAHSSAESPLTPTTLTPRPLRHSSSLAIQD